MNGETDETNLNGGIELAEQFGMGAALLAFFLAPLLRVLEGQKLLGAAAQFGLWIGAIAAAFFILRVIWCRASKMLKANSVIEIAPELPEAPAR